MPPHWPGNGALAGADGFLRGAEAGGACGYGGRTGALQRDRLSLAACAVCGAVALRHRPARARRSSCCASGRPRRRRWRSASGAIVVHSGYIPLVYFPEWFTARSVEFWREFLRDAPDGLCLALENVMEPGPDMLVQIAAAVNDPRFGLCLDVGHANTRVSETPPLDWIAPMAPWLRHVHLHNNDGDWDLHDALGQGMIPMPDILAALAEQCPAADSYDRKSEL